MQSVWSISVMRAFGVIALLAGSAGLSSCGTYVPAKNLFEANPTRTDVAEFGQSDQGRAEANLVGNIKCEVQNGIYRASLIRHEGRANVSYLGETWATQVTLKLTWDETSSVAPGLGFIHSKPASQSTSIGVGGSATAHSTRVETITFLFENAELLNDAKAWLTSPENTTQTALRDCAKRETGPQIHSDLKIAEFIVDKATLASTGIASTDDPSKAAFSTFQEDLTFVAAYSANLTPTWKLTRFTANTSGNFLAGTRTTTGDVLITLGPLAQDPDTKAYLHRLSEPAASQHTAGVIGAAVATQANSQTH